MSLCLALLLVGVTLMPSLSALPRVQSVVAVMPLGDSMTLGFDLAHQDRVPTGYRRSLYARLVADGYRVDFVGSRDDVSPDLPDGNNEGHGGLTIAQIAALTPGYLRQNPPSVVLLMIGANGLTTLGAEESARQLEALVALIGQQAPESSVLLATLPLTGAPYAEREVYNAAVPVYNALMAGIVLRRVSAGQSVALVVMTDVDVTGDGLHPSERGYRRMGETWAAALEPLLDDRFPCASWRRVDVHTMRGAPGELRVAVSTRSARNQITRVQFGAGVGVAAQVSDLVTNGRQTAFTVRRSGPGAAQQSFTVTDLCGAWPTFVGGGPGSF